MRASNVVGFTPKSSAALSAPPDFPAGLNERGEHILAAARLRFGFREHRGPAPVFQTRFGGRRHRGGMGYRQIETQGTAAGQNDRAFDDVAQFPDVAGPLVMLQSQQRSSRQPRLGTTSFFH